MSPSCMPRHALPVETLLRHGRQLPCGFAGAVMVLALASCGGGGSRGDGGDTEPLPLQESALAVGGDVADKATPVGSVALTAEQMDKIADRCKGAEGIPLEDGDCTNVEELVLGSSCGPSPICLTVYDIRGLDALAAGYVEVTDRRPAASRCDSDPGQVCLRVGVTEAVVARLAGTSPTSTTPSPSETPTETPSETATETATETPSETATETPPASDESEASPGAANLASTTPR